MELDLVSEAKENQLGVIRSQVTKLIGRGDRARALHLMRSMLEVDQNFSLDHELIVLTCPSRDARDDLRAYLAKDKPKVFLLAPLLSWQWRWGAKTIEEAITAAMEGARVRFGGVEAYIYMRNDDVVAPNEELSTLRRMLAEALK